MYAYMSTTSVFLLTGMPTEADAAAATVRQRYARWCWSCRTAADFICDILLFARFFSRAASDTPVPPTHSRSSHPTPPACSLRPFYSDLLNDFGATDTFLVDGDALLLELLGSERLDWSHGGQFLQLRAQLEQFVEGVQAANSARLRWWVVWFDCNRGLLPGGAASAARALAAACLSGTLGVPALRFPSWWSDQWHEWLAETRPAMLLLTDLPQQGGAGGSSDAAEDGALQLPAAEAAAADADATERRHLHLQAYIVAAQAAGLQCAFLSELRFTAEGRMHAFRTGWRAAPGAAGRPAGADAAAAEAQAVGIDFVAHAQPPEQSLDVGALLEWVASQVAPGGHELSCAEACCALFCPVLL